MSPHASPVIIAAMDVERAAGPFQICGSCRHTWPAWDKFVLDSGVRPPPARLMGTDQCRGHCLRLEDLAACDAPCSNARDRELILLVQRMKEFGIRGG